MKKSIRRIATGLLVVGLLSLSTVTMQQAVSLCANGQPSCLVAAVTFGVTGSNQPLAENEVINSISTPSVSVDEPSMASFVVSFVQVLSVYLILLSVLVLVVLELFELRYLRRLLRTRVRGV